ncbi:MAG: enoyl-CoA hydratase [Sinobacteraceae bacterium]|nr:enoyl-CoA hydratase [Nevskiaceae bacterium]
MSSDLLLVDQANGVYTLCLNRPDQFNALSMEMMAEIQDALATIAADESARCAVLAANGRAFCAGHDLKQMRANPDYAWQDRLFANCSRMMQAIVDLPVPVIARVQGLATAAGCQLVATCDLAVAVDSARFAVSGINVGLFCGTPAVALTRNVPIKKAFEMLITGKFISAVQAVENGLINHAVPAEELDGTVAELVEAICSKSPVAVRNGKAMYRRQKEMTLSEAYQYANGVMAGGMMAADAAEGIDAFKEKRAPAWQGR